MIFYKCWLVAYIHVHTSTELFSLLGSFCDTSDKKRSSGARWVQSFLWFKNSKHVYFFIILLIFLGKICEVLFSEFGAYAVKHVMGYLDVIEDV